MCGQDNEFQGAGLRSVERWYNFGSVRQAY